MLSFVFKLISSPQTRSLSESCACSMPNLVAYRYVTKVVICGHILYPFLQLGELPRRGTVAKRLTELLKEHRTNRTVMGPCGKEAVFDLATECFHSSQRQVILLLTHTIHSSFSHRRNQRRIDNQDNQYFYLF
jgi:hypothetical protein